MERLRLAASQDLESLPLVEEGESYPVSPTINVESYRKRFTEAMDDDFNTAQAIAALFDLAREINRFGEKGLSTTEARRALVEMAGVLGLTLRKEEMHLDAKPFFAMAVAYSIPIGREAPQASYYIDLLTKKRDELRKSKKWALADQLRNSLAELGIKLEDTPRGTHWRQER